MFCRRILFRVEQMSNPNIYSALRKDNVENWVDHQNGIAEASDFWSDDFPSLRKALEDNRASYKFHVFETLGNKPIWTLCSMMGFTFSGIKHGITEEDIKSLINAKA